MPDEMVEIELEKDLLARIQEQAKREGKTPEEYITEAVTDKLEW